MWKRRKREETQLGPCHPGAVGCRAAPGSTHRDSARELDSAERQGGGRDGFHQGVRTGLGQPLGGGSQWQCVSRKGIDQKTLVHRTKQGNLGHARSLEKPGWDGRSQSVLQREVGRLVDGRNPDAGRPHIGDAKHPMRGWQSQ